MWYLYHNRLREVRVFDSVVVRNTHDISIQTLPLKWYCSHFAPFEKCKHEANYLLIRTL